jgi:putative solute:sodium symporter small subunit
MASPKQKAHWEATRSLMIIVMAIWFFFAIFVFCIGEQINHIKFLGYPLAYYMTAQGSLIAFVVLIFWSNSRQEKIDREFGFSDLDREDD